MGIFNSNVETQNTQVWHSATLPVLSGALINDSVACRRRSSACGQGAETCPSAPPVLPPNVKFAYIVHSRYQKLLFLDKNIAYLYLMKEVNYDLYKFQKFFDEINKQSRKSKECFIELQKISDAQSQFEYYISHLEDIYDYFYDGGNECWCTYGFEVSTIEQIEIQESTDFPLNKLWEFT